MIKSFKPYYDAGEELSLFSYYMGVHWSNPKDCPELFIKNTILEVTRANEVVEDHFDRKFHYVNLDRDLMSISRLNSERNLKEQKNIAEQKVFLLLKLLNVFSHDYMLGWMPLS